MYYFELLFGLISSQEIPSYDIAVIGTGIVGLATARELIIRYPNLKFIVVDKENKIG